MKNKWVINAFLLVVLSVTALSCGPTGQGTNMPASSPHSNDSLNNRPFGQESTAQLVVGNPAPDFGLKDLTGKLVVLSKFRAEKVIVNMWDLQCHGCAEEIRFIEEYSKRFIDQGIVFLTVNVYQSADVLRLYMEGNKFTFTVLVDPDKVMPKSYVDAGTPTTYFIDGEGTIRQIKDGMFESVQQIIDLVNSY